MGPYHLLVLSPTATHSVSGGSDNSILRRASVTWKPLLLSEFYAKFSQEQESIEFLKLYKTYVRLVIPL